VDGVKRLRERYVARGMSRLTPSTIVHEVSGLLGLKVLLGVPVLVAQHSPAVDAVVGCIETMHGAVKTILHRFGLLIDSVEETKGVAVHWCMRPAMAVGSSLSSHPLRCSVSAGLSSCSVTA
jgi:hypothetical protein